MFVVLSCFFAVEFNFLIKKCDFRFADLLKTFYQSFKMFEELLNYVITIIKSIIKYKVLYVIFVENSIS